MRQTVLLTRVLAGFLLVLGFTALWVSPASATVPPLARITVHVAECPTGVGGDIFEECHDNVLEGVLFRISDTEVSEEIVSDEDGVVTFQVVAGSFDVAEDPDVLDDYLGAYVYCSDQNSGEVFFDGDLDGANNIFGTIAAGDDLVCDWYNITEADDADDDDDDGGTTLPSTGIGSAGSTDDTTLMLTLILVSLALGGAALGLRRRSAL